MSYATEKQPRRAFIASLFGGLGAVGVLGLSGGVEGHNLMSAAHPDTIAESPSTPGQIIRSDISGAAWQVLNPGLPGHLIRRADDGDLEWFPNTFAEKDASLQSTISFTAVGDNQAPMASSKDFQGRIVLYDFEVAGPNNALINFEGALHGPSHNVLGTFRYNFPPTGAGDIFRVTDTFMVVDNVRGEEGTYHINVTAITLNGGTAQSRCRAILGLTR